jgi:hypothetical protein
MDTFTLKGKRSAERDEVLEKLRYRFSELFLEVGLDFQQFWRRWEAYDRDHPQESRRDFKLMTETVMLAMYKGCHDSRPESLEALTEPE